MELTDELLAWCVFENRYDDVRFLITECGADLLAARDIYGDPVVCVAAAQGHTDVLELLLAGAAKESAYSLSKIVSARDTDNATPLVLACLHGHVECVRALLGAGASPYSKWQFMEPIHWATAYGHYACADELEGLTRVANASRVPRGRSTTVSLLDRTVNRLRPVPLCSGWCGRVWVQTSILNAVLAQGARGALATNHPALKALNIALRRYLYPDLYGKQVSNPPQLPAAVRQSVSVRPGVALGRAPDSDHPDHQRSVVPTINASIFGHQPNAHPEFVAIDPKFTDLGWDNWFGELCLAFACVDEHGRRHELMLLRWLWASTETLVRDERSGGYREVPYRTRYGLQNKYEVMSVDTAMHRAPVFRPPRFAEPEREVRSEPYIWAPDLYGIF
jgi:hypothetical protein